MAPVNCGSLVALIVGVAVLTLASTTGYAALPPMVFREMQDRAPEALLIVVLEIEDKQARTSRVERGRTVDVERHELTVTAIVERVTRSATGLRPLSIIKIAYAMVDEHSEGRPLPPTGGGSSAPGRLSQGERVSAYLKFDHQTGIYSPAAEHKSFTAWRQNFIVNCSMEDKEKRSRQTFDVDAFRQSISVRPGPFSAGGEVWPAIITGQIVTWTKEITVHSIDTDTGELTYRVHGLWHATNWKCTIEDNKLEPTRQSP